MSDLLLDENQAIICILHSRLNADHSLVPWVCVSLSSTFLVLQGCNMDAAFAQILIHP